jgi:hypothetical protein
MTLLEVLTASALFALLLGGMASSIFLARMTAYEAGDDTTTASAVSNALFWISQDVGEAISIEQATVDRLAVTVPDRDGDGAGEAIVYAWVASSSSLTRQLNAGTAEPLASGLSDFEFGYVSHTETIPGAASYGPEQLLMAHNSTTNLGNADVDVNKHRGQYFEPTLPAGAVSWIATRARLRMRSRGSLDGEATAQLRSAIGSLPGGEILAEVELRETMLTATYEWVDIRFSPAPEAIAAGAGVCLVVKGTGTGDACELLYQNNNSTAAGTEFVRSDNGGVQWTAPPEQDLLFELFGLVGTPAASVTQTYLDRVDFRAKIGGSGRVVYGSARVLNEPKVGN